MVHPSFELVCWACGQLLGAAPLASAPLLLQAPSVVLAWELPPVAVEAAPPKLRAMDAPSVGEVWSMREGRELRVFLTPTPERCAPLLEMTF